MVTGDPLPLPPLQDTASQTFSGPRYGAWIWSASGHNFRRLQRGWDVVATSVAIYCVSMLCVVIVVVVDVIKCSSLRFQFQNVLLQAFDVLMLGCNVCTSQAISTLHGCVIK